jgi:hypothetical protein
MAVFKNKGLQAFFVVHSLAVFLIGLLLFVAKWFPYGTSIGWMREWLSRFF